MFSTILHSLYQRWRLYSLRGKLLLPIVGLMLISLLGSTLAFVTGTALTRNQLLRQQVLADTDYVIQALTERVGTTVTAAEMLANDPNLVRSAQDDAETALSVLNSRSVVVRDRFDLDLIQIYDQDGHARTNLVLSSLYRESSLLDQVSAGTSIVRLVENRMLLLSRVDMPEGQGTVIAGIDLETELHRLTREYHLSSDLGVRIGEDHVATSERLTFDGPKGQTEDQYVWHTTLRLGETPVNLVLVRTTSDITQVMATGLAVMVGSVLFTTALLIGLSLLITRAMVQPIRQLSTAAEAVAKGDLSQSVSQSNHPLLIGSEDEISILTRTFNDMVADLRSLYGNLEAEVEARTGELTTAAEVARTVSSTLDLDTVLSRSVLLIQERLSLYFVGIFLVEPQSGQLVFHKGTGRAGELLKRQAFQISPESKSLVRLAATTETPRVAQAVSDDPFYLPSQLLPNTASEAAIPLLIGETVIGVLDVQSRESNFFTPDFVKLLLALADQVAIGVHNAQTYAQQLETAEDLAVANARLQELDQIKSEFIQNVSHELRTPLALIRGYAESLEDGLLGDIPEAHQQPIAIIARRSRVMSSLVEDITTLLEIEAQTSKREPVSMPQLVQNVFEDFQFLAEQNQLSLEAKIETDVKDVIGEQQHLRKVCDNLVNNAIKFTPPGGTVTMCLFQRNSHAVFQVCDSGIGIPPDKHGRVFERFYQVDGSSRRRYGGSGLGLALVKEIVEAHNGYVELESKPGCGSTFTVLIPTS